MQIYDPIHGYIKLSGVFAKIIDTKKFQRLRNIKQLGLTNLVFPSTNHTRFEHSLGVYYLASQFANQLDLSQQQTKTLKAAGLLHDIGHGPFSHSAEAILDNQTHEDLSIQKISKGEIAKLIKQAGISPKQVAKTIKGENFLGNIIASDIDVDRMDYLMRDSHYSGVAHGSIDSETIIRSAKIKNNQLVFSDKYLPALEGLLVARHLMYPTLYCNQKIRAGEAMLERAIEKLVDTDQIEKMEIMRMDDHQLKHKLRNSSNQEVQFLNNLLEQRSIFSTANSKNLPQKQLDKLKENFSDQEDLEEHIAYETKVDSKKILAKIIKQQEKQVSVKIDTNQGIKQLREISSLTDSLKQEPKIRLEIYCPKNLTEKIQPITNSIISKFKK